MFIKIPREFIERNAVNNLHTPTLYSHSTKIVRDFFWLRPKAIYKLYNKFLKNRELCLDFGCGGGVFLPTLSQSFNKIIGFDLELREAEKVVKHYNLTNVTLQHRDVYSDNLGMELFDAVFALDVLEHLPELELPIKKLHNCLKGNGLLFTSLPTENFTTKLTRALGKFEKPFDHYYTGDEVESFLQTHGFKRIHRSYLIPIFPMYLISVWQKEAGLEDAVITSPLENRIKSA